MPGQKGPGKKGRGIDSRNSRSRNTTPNSAAGPGVVPPTSDSSETAFLSLPIKSLSTFDGFDSNSSPSIPDSKSIDVDIELLSTLMTTAETRGEVSNMGMRKLSPLKRGRQEEIQQDLQRDAARKENEEVRRKKKESSKAKERPLTHGAHSAAPQDGSNLGPYFNLPTRFRGIMPNRKARGRRLPTRATKTTATPTTSSGPNSDSTFTDSAINTAASNPRHKSAREAGSASSSLSPVPQATPGPVVPEVEALPAPVVSVPDDGSSGDSSSDEHQPPPAAAVQKTMTFGDNPLKFPDPTRYEIPEVTPDMSDEEKKAIFDVAHYPHDDLSDLIPGTPPDKDFSNAKPTGQVQANTFATYLEPFFRPFSEEDLAFLREGGDRVNPFVIPPRGKKHYKEIWAEEDGAMSIDSTSAKRLQNQARGSIDDMNDNTAETDQISLGPMTSRLIALMRPENRPQTDSDGDEIMGDTNDELANILNGTSNRPDNLPPATRIPGLVNDTTIKREPPKMTGQQMDDRVKQELQFLGLMDLDAQPNYDEHRDDEIAERIRILQTRLKNQQMVNNARKAALVPRVKEQMAYQEYNTIREDLDTQVQAAYTKRTRTMGKSKKQKRAGGAGGGSHAAPSGMARPGIGDMTKTVMERRSKWVDVVGPVFENEKDLNKVPRERDEGSSIFTPEVLAPYIAAEKLKWEEGEDEEE